MAPRCKDSGHWPLRVAPVGKWWGLFRESPPSKFEGEAQFPVTVSWHATESEAEQAGAALASSPRAGSGEDGRYERKARGRSPDRCRNRSQGVRES